MIRFSLTQKLKTAYWDIIVQFIYFLLFFLLCQANVHAADPLRLINFRAIGDSAHTRIIALFNSKPNIRLQILDRPARLVINLPTIDFSMQNMSFKKQNALSVMLSDVRYAFSDIQTSRIILTSKTVFVVEKSIVKKLDNGLWQLLVDIRKSTQEKFDKILKNQQRSNFDAKLPLIPVQNFRVVLDPGHGGIDGGARGVTGVLEKDVTLDFARALQEELQKDPHISVILTRDSNVFLRLSERVKKAQEFGADLFISIHADTIDVHSLRGATVYTISDKASDAIAKSLAESENKVDLLDGLPADETLEVTDILMDLTRRETHTFSVNFANSVISSLSKSHINLINNPHRYANFQVLRASDIPSVLIEIGYLSNKEDEKLLNDPHWRKQMALSIAHSIRQFAEYRQKMVQPL
ncbi:N-acetylmuramoyl-L-alanine amidase family protein [Bartonella krasnovii]|uniref:N-acetylmuramoyl-L-alanine amidase n=1 Tax=Bartonella krasnovii TaxID=2267275 RepID=A0ABY3W091_9HYPH|nr:N-acetylmuramoyl-L-alanine amidase [Bartonella krasnovii]UNF29874.1 N-acetylmuramoyl-L-alanine amidase [Bartonella krasnovii]UNF36236.1 N-acetylmuramoyl-L-alanine amidase [Bartonella krasnovii]UNF39562.1 N-acetylmuramoyl-L-alanine amidase [Bartonella krasnovii]UNF49478.1 N-acetylmuramoyl-L-alanine amidase [Bartonella krasnovii]UNF51106.1 N-acetylmuramoyl-L-alanine amidase [Bartonella krasnovii]